jgi:hypothetical protein
MNGVRSTPIKWHADKVEFLMGGQPEYAHRSPEAFELARDVRRRNPNTSDEHLREVAEVYATASEKATHAVEEASRPTSHSTAALWVGEARRRGFLPPARQRTIATSAQSWVHEYPPNEQEKERRRLEGLGFVRAVSEHLIGSTKNGSEAISVVTQFRSQHSAVTNVEDEAKSTHSGERTFAVAGIPGAKGFGGNFGSSTGYNVAFAVGAYYNLVGEGYATGTRGAPTRQQLITAAQRLYVRVRH